MSNDVASVPLNVYVKESLSTSVAVTAVPILMFADTFSAIARVVLAPSENIGASLTFVTLMVTDILSLPPSPSETDTVTVYEDLVS